MNEENKGASKNRWSRIFRKKWFFPALYLAIAAVLLAGVIWYQNLEDQTQDVADDADEQSENYVPTPADDDAEPVVGQQEVIQMPVMKPEEAEIVTKFYDYNASQEEQENALVFHNNRYYQSTGIDITSADGETFDVSAALSGTVTEVKEDPLLGNVVILSHGEDISTYYASLGEVSVTPGDEVEQGSKIGTAGKNRFGQDNGTHVHFEIRQDGISVNPESYINQPVSSLNEATDEATEETEETEEAEPNSEQSQEDNDAVSEDDDDESVEDEDEAEEDEENSNTGR